MDGDGEFTNDVPRRIGKRGCAGLRLAGAEEKAILFEADRVAFEKTYHLDSQANVPAPNGELVRLKMSCAVDVIARRKRTDYQMQCLPKGMAEAAYEIRLNNSKREKITGEVRENMVGEWRILSKFPPDERNTDRCAQWHIEVLAEGEAILQYSIHSKFRQVRVQLSIPSFPGNAAAFSGIQPSLVGRCQTQPRLSRREMVVEFSRYYQTARVVPARRFLRLRRQSAHPPHFRSLGIPVIDLVVFCCRYARPASLSCGLRAAGCD